MDIDKKICEVCRKEDRKYKCPSCKINYCSLHCFKAHNTEGDCEQRRVNSFVIDTKPSLVHCPETSDDFLLVDDIKAANVIPQETLEKLDGDETLKNLLKNQHLRDFLSLLNSKDYPRGLMKNAMKEPLFVEFANACLNVVHPKSEQKELSDQEIAEKVQEIVESRAERN